jgi:hypothetical protein
MIKCKPDLLGLQCAVLLISDDKVWARLIKHTLSSEIYSTAHCKPNKSGWHFIIWDS